jgi:two-component system, OmpR family, phosphate regulon sensor histidine kinase PhoR
VNPFSLVFSIQFVILFLALLATGASSKTVFVTLVVFAAFTVFAFKKWFRSFSRLVERVRTERTDPWRWVDVEQVFARITSELQNKTETLSQEREETSVLMGAISDAILAVDLDGRPLFFNSRFAFLFGGKEIQERKLGLREIFRVPEVLALFREVTESGQAGQASVKIPTRDGVISRFFSLSVAPLKRGPNQQTVYGSVGVFHDITELKKVEKIRIDFVGNVSHELRTPLTAIKGYTDTLIQDFAKQDYQMAGKCLAAISRNLDRLMNLIGDLLDLSSIENETETEFAKTTVDTVEITERVLSQLEAKRIEKGHVFVTSCLASSVQADPRRLEQVLSNLLENAIKYVPRSGKIHVKWENEKDGVLLKVVDNGPGISREHQPRLFERFYRVDKGRSRDQGGTGLGLAIVKHIMQRHGGTVSVESEHGQGAAFSCYFPGN